jgi:mannose-6-phosphate isomerase-like protein (cupin superfamily)
MRTLSLLPAGAILTMALAAPVFGQQPAKTPRPATPSTVTVIPNAELLDAFKKGRPVLESDDYKVNAGRRDATGEAEEHARETDFFYVIEGTATIVTGGTMQSPRTVSPGELRGAGITGGETHTLTKGDVMVIPHGVPHWFNKVTQAPFLYFVVKSITPAP